MKPYETLKEQLLVELKTRDTDWFNCAHVISSSQMKAMVIKSGISNHKFEFNYSNAQGKGLFTVTKYLVGGTAMSLWFIFTDRPL